MMDLKKTEVKSTSSKMRKTRTKPEKKDESSVALKPVKKIVKIKSGKKRPLRAPVKQISHVGPVLGEKSRKKKKTRTRRKAPSRGVCYFSHIPRGFGGDQLQKYCSQFGTVTGVYEPVSKLGNSRGYAFVEFLHEDVAKIVAETMNNYLMFNRLIKCEYVPPEKQRPWVFRIKRNNPKIAGPSGKVVVEQRKPLTLEEKVKKVEKRKRRINSIQNKLKEQGIEFQFEVDEN